VAVIGHERLETRAPILDWAGAQLRRLAGRRGKRDERSGRGRARLVAIVEIGLVLLLGVLIGRLVLTIVAPGPMITDAPAPAARSAASAFSGNPFRLATAPPTAPASDTPPDAAVTTLDLALHGAWADPKGGSAIIKTPDGKQRRFSVGETICCGATLEAVYADQVTILRSGVREALRLPRNIPSVKAPSAAAAPEEAGETAPPAANLADAVRVEVDQGGSGAIRLKFYPGPDQALFDDLGLRSGDVLVSVNGEAAPTDLSGFAALMERFEGAASAAVIVEREGVRMPVEISVPGAVAPDSQ